MSWNYKIVNQEVAGNVSSINIKDYGRHKNDTTITSETIDDSGSKFSIFNNYTQGTSTYLKGEDLQRYVNDFNNADTDGDGELSITEFNTWLDESLCPNNTAETPEELAEWYALAVRVHADATDTSIPKNLEQIVTSEENINSVIDELQTQLNGAEETINNLTNDVNELEAQIAQLEAEKAELEAEKARAEEEAAQSERDFEQTRDELTASQEEVAAKDAEIAAKDAEIASKDAEIERLKEDQSQLTDELADARREKEDLENAMYALQQILTP